MEMADLCGLKHLFASIFLFHFASSAVIPDMADVTMAALCPGADECSVVIYLNGFQHVVTGLGALVVTPAVGSMSDKHGRKAMLTLAAAVAVIPLAILALQRTRAFVCAYYGVSVVTGIFSGASVQCLSLAYVADRVGPGRRAAAFGILSGVSAAGFVAGALAARFLPLSSTFQVAAVAAAAAAVYLRIFLPDSGAVAIEFRKGPNVESFDPLVLHSQSSSDEGASSTPRILPLKSKWPAAADAVTLLTSSSTLLKAAAVTFFNDVGDSGSRTALLYFLKAKFSYDKNQFADLLLIVGIASAFSQLIIVPLFTSRIGEEKLLKIGLIASFVHVLLYGLAWSFWVPYFSATIAMLTIFVNPCIRSIVSKKVSPTEQGIAQGCITGVSSFGGIIGPIIYTPLTAWFLSEEAPFDFKGFSLMCAGICYLVAFVVSIQ